MRAVIMALAMTTVIFAISPAAHAVPTYFNVRYSFTTDDLFLAKFGVQATVTGVARYSTGQADQLPDDPVSGLYDLVSHRIRIDGKNTTEAPNLFGTFTNEFNVLNDIGYAGPPPYYDGFAFGSSFNEGFGTGLTLTAVRVAGFAPSSLLGGDAIFRIDPADWSDVQGLLTFLPAGASLPSDQITIFGFRLDSFRVTPVPEPGTLALLAFGLAGLGLFPRRIGVKADAGP